MRKILILRGGALGDFIVTLPALLALRQHWGAAQLELVGNATAAELALRRGVLDRVHSQHERRWAALFADSELPLEFAGWLAEFDLVVSYWPDPDATLQRRFPLRPGQRFVTTSAMPTQSPAAAHYEAPLRELGIGVASHFCRIDSNQIGFPHQITALPGSLPDRRGFAAVHPGSGSAHKNWPAERWLTLMAALPSPILLLLGEAEERVWQPWCGRSFRGTPLESRVADGSVRIVRNRSIEETISEFRSCRLFLGHDSGVSHLAAACGVPCFLLFGPTDPAVWAPPADHVRVLRRGTDVAAISLADVEAAIAADEDNRPAG